jgi:V8-like Glu-specific endopeptidase
VEEDDWSAVALDDPKASERWGALALAPARIKAGDRVNIVQHPGGGYKQMSFFANTVAFVGGKRVQYLVDTLPGSSGSPVFDKDWNVVAVHHKGGWLTEPGGPSDRTFYRNQGILVDALIAGIAKARGGS